MVLHYTVILEPEPEGGYSVHCPALPGCAAQGESTSEALANISQAILEAVGAWAEDGLAPPLDSVDVLGDEIYEILAARAEDALPLTVETVGVEVPYEGPEQAALANGEDGPLVLTVQEDPRGGGLKRGSLRAFIRHSGMSTQEFLRYIGQEATMLEMRRIAMEGTEEDSSETS
jgi:predicted RNase H-like HicB family nuclease